MSCTECSLKHQREIKEAFAKMFPLADPSSLPSYPGHFQTFLTSRIELEVKRNIRHFEIDSSRMMCEVVSPKSSLLSMLREVVDLAAAKQETQDRLDNKIIEVAEVKESYKKFRESAQEKFDQRNEEHKEYREGAESFVKALAKKLGCNPFYQSILEAVHELVEKHGGGQGDGDNESESST